MVHTGLRDGRRRRAPPSPPRAARAARALALLSLPSECRCPPRTRAAWGPSPGRLPSPSSRGPHPQRPGSRSPPGRSIGSQACAPGRVFKVAKWWEGAPGWTHKLGSQAFCPFLSEPGPCTPRLRAPVREWKLPFPPEGGLRAAPAKSGSSRGEGTQARHFHFDCFDAIFGGGGVERPFFPEHKDV